MKLLVLATVVVRFLALGLVIGNLTVQAQDSFFGVKGGVSIPSLVGGGGNEVSRDYKSRLAPNFGGFLDLGITKRFSMQTEVNYAGQGGTREGVQPITSSLPGLPPLPTGVYYYGDFKTKAVLNYIELPVMAKYRWRADRGTRFYGNAGMFYGHLLNAKTLTSGSSTIYLTNTKTPLLLPPANQPLPPLSFKAETDIQESLHHNNVGFTGGGGIEVPRGRGYFLLDARVSYGFRVIQKDPLNGSSHTGNIVVSVGYAFNVHK